MQVGVKALNSEVFFKKLREPLDDRFLLFRAVAAAKAGDGRQDLVNIRAGRFERAVAESVGNKALRLRGLQPFLRDELLQLLLLLLLHIALPIAVNIRCGVDRTNKAVDQVLFAAQLDAGVNRPVDGSHDAFILAVRFVVLHNQHQNIFLRTTGMRDRDKRPDQFPFLIGKFITTVFHACHFFLPLSYHLFVSFSCTFRYF